MGENNNNKLYGLFQLSHEAEIAQLNYVRNLSEHPVMKGDAIEFFWREMIQNNIPQQYGVTHGKVIDSKGNTSDQIDIIIYAKEAVPLLFRSGSQCLVPVESVLGVFEVKNNVVGQIEYAAKKIASVRNLEPVFIIIKKDEDQQRGYPIIGGILSCVSYEKKGSLEERIKKLDNKQTIDMGCCANKHAFFVDYKDKWGSEYANRKYQGVQFYDKCIISVFIMQLLYSLMRISKISSGLVPDIDKYLKIMHANVDAYAESIDLLLGISQ